MVINHFVLTPCKAGQKLENKLGQNSLNSFTSKWETKENSHLKTGLQS